MKNHIYTDRNSTSNSKVTFFIFHGQKKTEPRVYAALIKYVYFILECINFHRQKTNLMKRKPHSEQKRKHQRKETFVCSDVRGLT